MSPGAVAAILYARCRHCEPTFALESEPSVDPRCFVVTASWGQRGQGGKTYSSQLAIDVPDIVVLLRHALARLDQRAELGS